MDPIELMKLKDVVDTLEAAADAFEKVREHRRDDRAQGVLSPVEIAFVILVVAFALGFDYTNGFHDAANAIATSVSTRALTPRAALIMAAVFNLLGAMLGTEVAQTIGSGIITITEARTTAPRVGHGALRGRSARSRGTSSPGGSACPRRRRTR